MTGEDVGTDQYASEGAAEYSGGAGTEPSDGAGAEPSDGAAEPSDGELLEQLRAGDDAAYGELYSRHVAAARRLARRFARQPADAEDLVATSFAQILGAIRNGAGPRETFRYYLLACVRRNGGRYCAERWTMPLEDAENLGDPALAVGAADDLDRMLAWRAFRELPQRSQLVLWHALVEGDSLGDIGRLLGMNANATGVVLHRAKEALRRAFLAELVNAPRPPGSCTVPGTDLAAYARGTLSTRKAAWLEEHLPTCADCRARLLEIEPVEQAMRLLIAPAVLGIPLAQYLARPRVGAGWVAGGGAAVVAGVVAAVLWWPHPAAPVPDAAPTVGAVAASSAPGGPRVPAGPSVSGGAASAANPSDLDAVAPASPAAGSAMSQPFVPVLYPGDAGTVRLLVDLGEVGASVHVELPAQLVVTDALLSPSCVLSAPHAVTCGPLTGVTSVNVPFTLAPDTPLSSRIPAGQAWVERDGAQVGEPVPVAVAVHADPCCTTH